MISFGLRYEDEVTGLAGVATARTEHMHGTVMVCLEFVGQDGKPDEVWLPELRLRPCDDKRVGLR